MLHNNKKFLRWVVGLLVLGCCLSTRSVQAQSKTLVWDEYITDIVINADGTLRVRETQTINFISGTFTEGFADIPTIYTEGIHSVHVSEPTRTYRQVDASAGGSAYTYFTEMSGSTFSIIWNFPTVSAGDTRTFYLDYVVDGAIRVAGTGDILTWTAIPESLPFPVKHAEVTVTLPNGATLLEDPEAESGDIKATWKVDEPLIQFTFPDQTIPAYQAIKTRVTFSHGFIPNIAPSWQKDAEAAIEKENFTKQWGPLLDLLGCVTGLVGLLFGGLLPPLLWRLQGKDPDPGTVPDYVSEPPSDLPAGLVGTLVDESVDTMDITATLIEFARQGWSEMLEQPNNRIVFKKLQDIPSSAPLYQQKLFNAFFGKQAVQSLGSYLPNSFFAALPAVRELMYKEVTDRKLFNDAPDKVRGRYRWLGFLALLLIIPAFCGVGFLADYSGNFVTLLLLPLFLGIGLLIAAKNMPVKTRTGATEAAMWRAFKKYMENIGKYRDLQQVTDQFEKYLPYAVAFGLERTWIRFFAQPQTGGGGYYTPMPRWYRPYNAGTVTPGGAQASPAKPSPLPEAGLPPKSMAEQLNQMGSGSLQGLNSMGDNLIGALNAAGRSVTNPAPPPPSAGGSSGSFRSGGGGFSGGGSSFRGGGGGFSSGGGGRGFR